MRRITVILMSIAALALASSCNKNLNTDGAAPDGYIRKTVHISASELLSGKASFGENTGDGYPVFWSEGDKVLLSINGAKAQEITVKPEGDGSTADFGTLELNLPENGPVEIFVSTNTTVASGGRTGTIKYSQTENESQTPSGNSCDPSSIIIYASKTYENAAAVPKDIRLDFAHYTAYGKMTISGISLNGGETVKYVEIQTPLGQNIGGSVTIGEEGASHTSITLRGIGDLSNPVWFAIAPAELNSSEALYVHVVTSENRHFEKILNCSSRALKFQTGRVSKFTVNFSGIASAPRQVKTPRDLVLLKNAIQKSDYAFWMDDKGVIKMAGDLDYNGTAVSGNNCTLPKGVIFDGQDHAIKNADISASIFKEVKGAVKNLKFENSSNSMYLFETVSGTVQNIGITGLTSTANLITTVAGTAENIIIEGLTTSSPLINTVSGTLVGLNVDAASEYNCTWPESTSGYNTGFVTRTNSGLIQNCTTAATINAGDPQRKSFNFGVFCPRVTTGQFANCVNTGNVTLETSTAVMTGCGLGGIVGTIASTQSNEVKILDRCRNEGNVTLTLKTPSSDYHRVCCVGGVVGGSYSGGAWMEDSYPSTGWIYECSNSGVVTLNYNCSWQNPNANNPGSQGASIGGVIGATINDISHCSNSGSVIANFNVGDTKIYAGAPKVGGVVGAAHGKVLSCDNESTAAVQINGYVRNVSSSLYPGTGPVCQPAFGGVAGCVGCGGSGNDNVVAKTNSDNAGSEISNCINKSANVTNNAGKNSTTTIYVASVCGWTVALNSGNTDLGGTGLPVINPE